MTKEKNRKSPWMATVHARHFYEEGIKAIGFLGFIHQMASHIDSASHKASKALYDVKDVFPELFKNKDFSTTPPEFQPITYKRLEQFDNYIGGLAYVQTMDQVNYYLGNCLKEIFSIYPNMLKEKKEVSIERVLSFPDMKQLQNELAEERVRSLMYKSMIDLFAYLKDKHGISPFSDSAEIIFFNDCNLKRNLLVHNSGNVNKIFLEKYSKPESYKLGQNLDLGSKDAFAFIPEALKFVVSIDKYLCGKFEIPQKRLPSKKLTAKWTSFLKSKRKRK